MSNLTEESDAAFEYFYGSDEYEMLMDRIAQQEKEDWESREMYGIDW